MKWILQLVVIVAIFVTGIFIGTSFLKPSTQTSNTGGGINYPYLARRIFFENPNDVILNFTVLREDLRKYVADSESYLGVYFEYLATGTSIGVNEKEVFAAASLLKIPLAMEVLNEIEKGSISKDETLIIKANHIDRGYGDLWKKGAGSKITVNEALHESVVNSDNTAYRVLREMLGNEGLKEIYDYLDLPAEFTTNQIGGITPKNYSSVLKSLFFSAYLSYNSSNELLHLMTIPTNHDRLSHGVDKDVKVANKFGIYTNSDSELQTYTDCGIVYLPKRSYMICVMVKDVENFDEAGKQIVEVSKMVFDYVKSANAVNQSLK